MRKLSMSPDVLMRKEGDQSLVTLTLFSNTHYMVCDNDFIENVT